MGTFVTVIDGVVVVRPTGRLNAAAAGEFDRRVTEVIEGEARLLFDFSRVTYAASGALRVVLSAAKRLGASGGTMAVCCLAPNVKDVFHLAGLTTVIEIHPTRAAGLKALAAGR